MFDIATYVFVSLFLHVFFNDRISLPNTGKSSNVTTERMIENIISAIRLHMSCCLAGQHGICTSHLVSEHEVGAVGLWRMKD